MAILKKFNRIVRRFLRGSVEPYQLHVSRACEMFKPGSRRTFRPPNAVLNDCLICGGRMAISTVDQRPRALARVLSLRTFACTCGYQQSFIIARTHDLQVNEFN